MATGWQANVVAGTPILSAWGNTIRDRTVVPFNTAAERDAAITAPTMGMVVCVAGALQVYNGTAWTSDLAPRRGIIASGTQLAAPASGIGLPITTVLNGAGSWLNASIVTIPVGAGGLYLIELAVEVVSPTVIAVGFDLRNGVGAVLAPPCNVAGMIATGNPPNTLHGTWLRQCADTEAFRVYNRGNAITAGSAQVMRFSLIRMGDGLAAA